MHYKNKILIIWKPILWTKLSYAVLQIVYDIFSRIVPTQIAYDRVSLAGLFTAVQQQCSCQLNLIRQMSLDFNLSAAFDYRRLRPFLWSLINLH